MMQNSFVVPRSIPGIKRLASRLKSDLSVSQHEALDEAARRANFENYKHAKNALSNEVASLVNNHVVYITSLWKDKSTQAYGRETLKLEIENRFENIIEWKSATNSRGLGPFKLSGPDHIECRHLRSSQDESRRTVCLAARTIHFIQATGLTPSKSHSRIYPKGTSTNVIPGKDHSSAWYHKHTKQYLFIDEPYEPAAEYAMEERKAWAAKFDRVIVKPEWQGMYNPDGGSRLFIIGESSMIASITTIINKLNQLPAPAVSTNWQGESIPGFSVFVSNATVEKEQLRKQNEKPKKPTSGPLKTVAYSTVLSRGQRKPKAMMTLDDHRKIGSLIKSVMIATSMRDGIYNPLDKVRSELEDWLHVDRIAEHLNNPDFFDVYYHEGNHSFDKHLTSEQKELHLASLSEIKKILTKSYPECKPVKAIVLKIDSAIKSLQNWK